MSRFHLAPSGAIFNLDEISLLRVRDDGDYDLGWSGVPLADHIDCVDGESLRDAIIPPPTPVELVWVEVSLLGHQVSIGRMDWSQRTAPSFDLLEPDGSVIHVSANALYSIRQTTDPSLVEPPAPEVPVQAFIGWDANGECCGTITAPTLAIGRQIHPWLVRVIPRDHATPEELEQAYLAYLADMPF